MIEVGYVLKNMNPVEGAKIGRAAHQPIARRNRRAILQAGQSVPSQSQPTERNDQPSQRESSHPKV